MLFAQGGWRRILEGKGGLSKEVDEDENVQQHRLRRLRAGRARRADETLVLRAPGEGGVGEVLSESVGDLDVDEVEAVVRLETLQQKLAEDRVLRVTFCVWTGPRGY